MRRIFGITVLCFSLFMAGCGNHDYKKTPEGLTYKIFSSGKGDLIQTGTFLKVHYDAILGDSVLFSTFGKIPVYGRYDSMPQAAYDFLDFLGEMRVGDSAVYVRSVDTLVAKGFVQYGGAFQKGATIEGHLKILGTLASDAEIGPDQQKETAMQKDREVDALEKFLKDQKVSNYEKTPEGVFVVMEKAGDGAAVDSGMYAVVKYTGRLKDGTKFDSNIDSAFGHLDPLEFMVGTRQVIAGWDIGIQKFRVGGKGKLYIPATLGYGMQGQGEKLPPYSDLIFDIEILDVKQGETPPELNQ